MKADDKKVVIVTLFDALTSGTEYNVNTKNVVAADDTVIATDDDKFTYVKADVDKVEFTATTVAPGTNLKDVIKVSDKLGRDITDEVELEFFSSNTNVINAAGVAQSLPSGTNSATAVVKVSVKGTTVATANTVVTVKAQTPTTFVGYHIAAEDGSGNFPVVDSDAFKELEADEIVHFVYLNDNAKKLGLFFEDQYGNKLSAIEDGTAEGATFTNLTPDVVVVSSNGTVTPISVGTGYVKVKVGEVEQTVAIEVKATPEFTTFDVETTDVTAVESGIAATFKLLYTDQYGKEIAVPGTANVTAVSADPTIATATLASDKKSVSVSGKKAGATTIKVTYTDNSNPAKPVKFEKVVNVTVTAKGAFTGYVVEVDQTNLNVVDDNTTTVDERQATIKVYEVDANGQKTKLVAPADTDLVLLDQDGKEVSGTTGSYISFNDNTDVVSAVAKGTEAIAVKIGNLTLENITFTVADSTPAYTSVVFTNNALPGLAVGDTLENKVLGLVKVYDQYNKEIASPSLDIPNGKLVITNETNGFAVDSTGNVTLTDATQDATADLVVTEIVENTKTTNLLKAPVIVKAVIKAPVSVSHASEEFDDEETRSVTTLSLEQSGLTQVDITAGSDTLTFAYASGAWSLTTSGYTEDTNDSDDTAEETALKDAGYTIYKDTNGDKVVVKFETDSIKFAWTNGVTVSELEENFASTFAISVQ